MSKILKYIAQETSGESFKSHKFCFDNSKNQSVDYEDNQEITIKAYGETDKITSTKNLKKHADKINKTCEPLFTYFLDGSRKVYKIDDISYNRRLYPIVGGQVGVSCCERKNKDSFKIKIFENHLVLSMPDCASQTKKKQLFFENLRKKINELNILKKRNLHLSKILSYKDQLAEGEKYEHKGIATIQDEMINLEKKIVAELAVKNSLNQDNYLLKDGSLEYKKMKTGDYKDLSIIKSNYKCVVGVSKTFNPEMCIDERKKSNATKIAKLPLYHRTPAYMYETDYVQGVRFSIWYLRIRPAEYTISPFDGIIKIEKILISDDELKNGLDSEEIDLISSNLINERNPVCYGTDGRWANHLYPIYLTEKLIKSKYLSEQYFLNIF